MRPWGNSQLTIQGLVLTKVSLTLSPQRIPRVPTVSVCRMTLLSRKCKIQDRKRKAKKSFALWLLMSCCCELVWKTSLHSVVYVLGLPSSNIVPFVTWGKTNIAYDHFLRDALGCIIMERKKQMGVRGRRLWCKWDGGWSCRLPRYLSNYTLHK